MYVLRSKHGAKHWRCRRVEKQFGSGFGEGSKLEKMMGNRLIQSSIFQGNDGVRLCDYGDYGIEFVVGEINRNPRK